LVAPIKEEKKNVEGLGLVNQSLGSQNKFSEDGGDKAWRHEFVSDFIFILFVGS